METQEGDTPPKAGDFVLTIGKRRFESPRGDTLGVTGARR
jgi:hypothetical protein